VTALADTLESADNAHAFALFLNEEGTQ
jgi:hypothetical protein